MKRAFTLSEVLIAVGIIGVVASIMIPQVVVSYSKKVTVNKLKKNYSVIQQAIKRSELDNEPVTTWDTSLKGQEFFEKYFKNYFNNTTAISTNELIQKTELSPRKLLNGQNYAGRTYTDNTNAIHFLNNDGSLITIHKEPATIGTLWIGIDVNGLKEPNTIGKDTFLFVFTTQYGLRPIGDLGTKNSGGNEVCNNCTRNKLIGTEKCACNRQKNGYWCTYLIMNDNWEIRKDYPW